jgi:hypothetical protein
MIGLVAKNVLRDPMIMKQKMSRKNEAKAALFLKNLDKWHNILDIT